MESVGNSETGNVKPKKPFDKRRWREQKYSNRKKIDEWQERRKKNAFFKCRKALKRELPQGKSLPSFQNVLDKRSKKLSRYEEAMLEYERIQQERQKQREEAMKAATERKAALKLKRKLRADRNRKHSQKTAKGQPVMKNQIEILLEKIQNMQ